MRNSFVMCGRGHVGDAVLPEGGVDIGVRRCSGRASGVNVR